MYKFISIVVVLVFSSSLYSQIDISSVEYNDSSVVIKHSSGRLKYFVKQLSNPPQIEIDISNALFKTLIDKPVNSNLVRRIKTSIDNSISKIVVELNKDVIYNVLETKTELILRLSLKDVNEKRKEEVKVIAPLGKSQSKKTSYYTPKKDIMDNLPKYRYDFEYSDSDIKDVIIQLAARIGVNVVFGNEVSGNITVSLRNVPFDEGFKTILNMKGLVTQQIGDNILKISTPNKLLEEQKNAYLETRIFFLNYVKASTLKPQIESIAQAEGRTTSKCNIDETNNALIITDTPRGLEMFERIIKKLDRIPKQVLIEAKLVEVNLDSGLYTGIQWSVSGNRSGNYLGANSPDAAVGPISRWGGQKSITPGYSGSYAGTGANLMPSKGGTGVELAAKEIYGAFRFGRITSNFMLDAVISASAKKGKANILSNPKIATLNNVEANIDITNQLPYVTQNITYVSGNSVTSTEVTYINTGILLKVLPTITSDGRIVMRVNPIVSQPSQPAPLSPPSVDRRSADTTVVVNDGETIVIGGLIHDYESDYVYKVPVLGDIPVLGYLFKKKIKERQRRELLIFVTPKIVEL